MKEFSYRRPSRVGEALSLVAEQDGARFLGGGTMRPRPNDVVDLEEFRVRRRDRAGGLHHEYRQVA